MKAKYLIITSLIILSISAFSQKKGDFDLWDGNHDGKLDRQEYELNTKIFSDWDKNNDNRISQEEFQKGLYGLFTNSNKGIDSKEWGKAVSILNTQTDTTKSKQFYFEAYDTDKDGLVSPAEFTNVAVEVFNSWDENGDNYISKSEFVQNSFNWWDQNRNGIIEREEFNRLRELRGDDGFWQKIF
jgi:Ca2+-binding EF-hand superfamily protein